MLEEAITTTAIIAASVAANWYVRLKFQPEIEGNLARQERSEVVEQFHKKRKEHQ